MCNVVVVLTSCALLAFTCTFLSRSILFAFLGCTFLSRARSFLLRRMQISYCWRSFIQQDYSNIFDRLDVFTGAVNFTIHWPDHTKFIWIHHMDRSGFHFYCNKTVLLQKATHGLGYSIHFGFAAIAY